MKCALYARVSTEEQALHGISIDAQLNELREYAKKHNYTVYNEYIDAGYSGGLLHRPALDRLLEDASDKCFQVVIFVKLDRWFRSVAHYYKIQEKLEANNINWIATQEDYETVTSSGKFKVNIMLSVSQQMKDATSERVKSAFNYKVSVKKEAIQGSKIYGYDIIDKHYVVNKKEAEILNQYYDEFIRTNNLLQSSYWWWDNIGQLDRKHLRIRLTDRRYIGEYNYHGTIYYDYIPAIINKEKFDKVQEILKMNVKGYSTKRKRYYIYAGIAKCGICGGAFTGTHHNNTDTKYYRCNFHTQRKCINPVNINEKELEKKVLEQLIKVTNDKMLELKTKSKQKKVVDKTPQIKEKINRLNELYIEGMIDKNIYKTKLETLNKELNQYKQPAPKAVKNYEQILSGTFLELYNKLDDNHKMLYNRNIIKRISITDRDNILVELVD